MMKNSERRKIGSKPGDFQVNVTYLGVQGISTINEIELCVGGSGVGGQKGRYTGTIWILSTKEEDPSLL